MGGTRSSGASRSTGFPDISKQVEEGLYGIKKVVFWTDGSVLSPEEVRARRELMAEVARNVPPEALADLNRLTITEQNAWIGSAYSPEDSRRNYVSDEITIAMEQVRRLGKSVVYEEIGHRMQLKTHRDLFSRFSRDVDWDSAESRNFVGLTNEQISRRMKTMELSRREIVAGEMFAKSFGSYKAGENLPEHLRDWWRRARV